MNGICHKIGGITASVITAYTIVSEITPTVLVTSIVAGTLGSLVPDIDEPNSTLGRKVKLLSKGIKVIFGHRGILHTPFFLILVSVGLFFALKQCPEEYLVLATQASIFFIIGYLSHLVLDTLTPAGIMLLYPFSKNKMGIIGMKGKYRDILVSAICILILLLFLTFKYDILIFQKYETISLAKEFIDSIVNGWSLRFLHD